MKNQQKRTSWIYLSYPLEKSTPVYGGSNDGFKLKPVKRLDQGDSCNTSKWTVPNHIGTHLDFPRHFARTGNTIDDYPIDFFIFRQIGFADISPVSNAYIISWQDIEWRELPDNLDILLIKTGFGEKRNRPIYWQENPGFSPEMAQKLRERFPELRVIGFDSISLSSLKHREIGRQAHKCFLDHRQPILPIEDMDLRQMNGTCHYKQLIVAPWRVGDADAAPCTVMAEVMGEK